MTTVYFVRHAEPNYDNHDDFSRELSPKGLQDRLLVTAFLMDKGIDAILSSPFKRAVDTVRDFAEKTGLDIVTVDDFRERRVDSGWIEDFDTFCRKQWGDFTYKLSDGESLGEVQRRNIRALDQVLAQYAGKNIVIGSHGTALSTIINHYDPSFAHPDFQRIKRLMPWVVQFDFDGKSLVAIHQYDLFAYSIGPHITQHHRRQPPATHFSCNFSLL